MTQIEKPFQPRVTGSLSIGYGDFVRFSKFVEQRFGLNYPAQRRTELESGVSRAYSASTCANLDEYFNLLQDPMHGSLDTQSLINALTIGETYFFRDAGQFDALTNSVLPEIIERRKSVRTLRLWSAGCASGEEPYSLAMLLVDLIPDLSKWNITILATDINTHSLERARRGVYGEWAFREARARQLRPRFFNAPGPNQYELKPEIRKMVTFSQVNLVNDEYPSYNNNTTYMDLILCRNVTIYFPAEVAGKVLDCFYNGLVDDGWLVVGHSEHSLNSYQRFHVVKFPDAILYQRRTTPPPTSPETADKPASVLNNKKVIEQILNIPPDLVLPGTAQLRLHRNNGSFAGGPQTDGEKPALSPEGLPESLSEGITEELVDPDLLEPEPLKEVAQHPQEVKIQPRPPEAAVPISDPIDHALTLMGIGKMEETVEFLLRFLTRYPNHAQACSLLGKTYAGLGNYPEAERWCHLAVVLDKNCIEAYYTLALVYEHQGISDQAIEMMKRVIQIDRSDILSYYSLAGIFHNRGQTGLALKALENARRLVGLHQPDEIVSRSDGITMLRLGQAIIQKQRQWNAELSNAGKE